MFANDLGDQGSIPVQVIPKTQKIVLDSSLIPERPSMRRHVPPWANVTIGRPAAHVTSKISILGAYIYPIHSFEPSQTCCWPTYLVIEFTRITYGLPSKDLCKISLLFAVMRLYMAVESSFKRIYHIADVLAGTCLGQG